MRNCLLSPSVLLITATCLHAAVISRWTFNSPVPDGTAGTGTKAPSVGSGSVSYAGGAAAASSGEFSSGDTKGDPAGSTDNSAWNTSKYPSAATSNKVSGVRFAVPTTDYEGITISWSQQNSGSASRYSRLQYALDGASFVDADVIAIYADGAFTNKAVDLSGVAGVANNPAFAFQLVTEFESTATGSGTNAYIATRNGSSYTTSGTIRFDVVTVSGTPLPGANTPPNISGMNNQTLRVNQSSSELPFTVWDAEDPPENLVLGKTSSDPAVVPEAGIVFGGSGANRTAALTAGTRPGTARVTLYVSDTGSKSNSTAFVVTVLPTDTAPYVSPIVSTNTLMGVASPALNFTVGDLESPASSLSVSASSANPALVPNSPANFLFGGSDSNRTLSVSPAPGQSGVAPITVTVSDGVNSSSSVFGLMVRPSASVVLYEPFDYPDGSLATNSGFLWDNRSGTFGQCQVTNGQLQLTATQTEDVVARLAGAPYAKSNGIVLYAGFKMKFTSLPKSAPGYFAHFADGSVLRGRLYATSSNTMSGFYHLLVANGSDTNTLMLWNLYTNTVYTIVTRYNIDAASTTLWLDPTAESDPGVTATDPQTAVPITGYGFRQDSDIGARILIDDLRVGLSFAAALPGSTISPIPLLPEPDGAQLRLRWSDPAFGLQSAPAVAGPYTNIPGASSPFSVPMSEKVRFFRLKSL